MILRRSKLLTIAFVLSIPSGPLLAAHTDGHDNGDSGLGFGRNKPPVAENQTFSIVENLPAMTFVGRVIATDPNRNDTLAYELIGGNDAGLFGLDRQSGDITTTAPLDHETAVSHTLIVKVLDRLGLSDTATVLVNVSDQLELISSYSELAGNNGFAIPGLAESDQLGTSVSGAGDVNKDGFEDFIIGASDADPEGRIDAGESYVVFGRPGGFDAGFDLASLDGSNGFRLGGIADNEEAGGSVSGAGDLNGDGFFDLVIGARDAAGVQVLAGRVYVVYGSQGGFGSSLDLATLDGGNGFQIDGLAALDRLGTSVNSAGDVNGDGLDDIVMGAPGAVAGFNSRAGQTYVLFGTDTVFDPSFDLASLDGTNGFRLDGIAQNDGSGTSVSSAGDVNGDGFSDILISAARADPNSKDAAGEIYLVFGGSGAFPAVLDLQALDGISGFRIEGLNAFDLLGASVSSAGDFNGDGIDDFMVSATGVDDGSINAVGEVYVVYGTDQGFPANFPLASLNGANGFRLRGVDAFDNTGASASTAGDFNGDGFDDIIIGAPNTSASGGPGKTYLIYGSNQIFNSIIDLALLDLSDGFRVEGITNGDGVGRSVSSSGDINGDGYDDLVVGAPFANPGGVPVSGESYVMFGGNFTQDVTHEGTSTDDVLAGTAGSDVMVAGRGDDTLLSFGGGDVLYGGQGNDNIVLSDMQFFRIDGGSGEDSLDIDGFDLDLTVVQDSFINGIEVIDLTDGSGTTFTFGLRDLRNLSSTSNKLTVRGDANDVVIADLQGAGFLRTELASGFTEYFNGTLTLLLESSLDDSSIFF